MKSVILMPGKWHNTIFLTNELLPGLIVLAVLCFCVSIIAQQVGPVLEFPQTGLDDTSTYRGYSTRFYKDSKGNTLQISLNQKTGRVVNLWADAANESISFSARNASGQPAKLAWFSEGAQLSEDGKTRFVQYTLVSPFPELHIGHFLLGSMRKERDYQHFQHHLQAFNSEPFIENELKKLIIHLENLPDPKRERQLNILKAKDINKLRSRLVHRISQTKNESVSAVQIKQTLFDGKNQLSLELSVNNKDAQIVVDKMFVKIRSFSGQPIQFRVKISTDSPPLHPLRREDIFNNDFFQFYESVKLKHDNFLGSSRQAGPEILQNENVSRFKRLERQVKSMELMCFQEKLFAGVPNYATYFGRDMMMSALMLEPVLNPTMLEHVIASVLRKLSPTGEVSHEEALGGQAIRENAGMYNNLMKDYFRQMADKKQAAADRILADAENVLLNLQAVTENYHMVDDDFQLPVLFARFLVRPDITPEMKREFLLANSGFSPGITCLNLLIRNLIYVTQVSRPYAEEALVENLISFFKIDDQRWHPGSWRDSGVGYANGRFAMDINVIWVPAALESINSMLKSFGQIDISNDDIKAHVPKFQNTILIKYLSDTLALEEAIKTWRGTVQHFEVSLDPDEVQQRINAKLNWLPAGEKKYWQNQNTTNAMQEKGIEFLALSLNEKGEPIPVLHTDLATWLFLEDITEKILKYQLDADDIVRQLQLFVNPYPYGLFIKGVGPVVANDAFASADVWNKFQGDLYHSPRVIWGREVNLLLLGLAKQIAAAYDDKSQIKDARLNTFVRELKAILNKTYAAVKASGLKHNELWSYRIEDDKVLPERYAKTTDIQLWNLTDLAVQYQIENISLILK